MRRIGLVGLAMMASACGRVGFEPGVSSGDRGDSGAPLGDGDSLLSCPITRAPLIAPSPTMSLAATARTGGFAAAWVREDVAASPRFARFDTQLQLASGPVALATAGDAIAGLVDNGVGEYLVLAEGGVDHIIAIDGALGDTLIDTGVGRVGPGCLMHNEAGDRTVAVFGTGSGFSASYLTGAGLGPAGTFVPGLVAIDLSCHSGTTHGHVQWQDASDFCSGVTLDYGAMPTFGSTIDFGLCLEMHSTVVSFADDTSAIAWSGFPGIGTAYITDVPDPAVLAHDPGTSPRISSAAGVIWIAWLQADGVHVGHRTPTSAVIESPLPALVPLGSNAFQLVSDGTRVLLVVLTATELVWLELCA